MKNVPMETIKDILKRRDGLEDYEAYERIEEAKEALNEYLDDGDIEAAENICEEFFGLEPDYVMELLD